MKKLFSVLAVCFLFASLIVTTLPSADALTLGVAFHYDDGASADTTFTIEDVHPSYDADTSAFGASFTSQETGYLYQIEFYVRKQGLPTGAYTCSLSGVDGTVNSDNARPNATVFAQSETVLFASDLSGSVMDWVTFTFNRTYLLNVNVDYAAYVYGVNETLSSTSYILPKIKGSDVTNMTGCSFANGAWTTRSNYNPHLNVYVDTDETPSATPTPAPTSSGSGSGDSTIEDLTNVILPWLVPLLICLILALLGYKFVGEMGFFIGLNVGVILAFVTLANTAYAFPLWGVILVGFMDVAIVLMRR